ncbi:hypothetical protein Sjap_021278 [Stephania japonica]|uniref:Uncharacterized protein n=1 Tax=Stephania japonica TaxID=461633 RepID=A0AAP0ELP2_9MAGN
MKNYSSSHGESEQENERLSSTTTLTQALLMKKSETYYSPSPSLDNHDHDGGENPEEVFLDWKRRPCHPTNHGGVLAALCVLGLQIADIMANMAAAANLIMYLTNQMHFPLPKAANTVTNFLGTQNLLCLLGGFISDTYLGSFWTMLVFSFVELSGFMLLAIQAHLPQLRPPQCETSSKSCVEANGLQSFILYAGLYLVAVGSGCIKPNIASHGADQFKNGEPGQSRKISSFFNAGYFTCCISSLFANTVLVWTETREGMAVGFTISASSMVVGIVILVSGIPRYRNSPPGGNIFLTIAQCLMTFEFHVYKVCVAAVLNRNNRSEATTDHGIEDQLGDNGKVSSYVYSNRRFSKKFRFLDNACTPNGRRTKESSWRQCTGIQVDQVKIMMAAIPIFASTVFFQTISAQLQTFSVQQGKAMDNQLTRKFQIPPASLQAIPYLMLIFLVPLYEVAFVPLMRKVTKIESGVTPLQRVGVGLFIATFSMVASALSEEKRRKASIDSGKILSIFWIVPQYLVFGLSEMFASVGLIEFFYKQSLGRMQSFLAAINYCSYSFGFFLSSALVDIVNKMSSHSSRSTKGGWLSKDNLDEDKLDLFYWLLASLSFVNFLNYLYWANWFPRDTSVTSPITTLPHDSSADEFGAGKIVIISENGNFTAHNVMP